jgi:hypothetical protein
MLGVNDNKDVDVKCPQTMRCIFCYNSFVLFYNLKTQAKKGLIIYNTINGITTLKKHVNIEQIIIVIFFEGEVNTIILGQLLHKLYIYICFIEVFRKKKLNVENLANKIKAGSQIRTHDQYKILMLN